MQGEEGSVFIWRDFVLNKRRFTKQKNGNQGRAVILEISGGKSNRGGKGGTSGRQITWPVKCQLTSEDP